MKKYIKENITDYIKDDLQIIHYEVLYHGTTLNRYNQIKNDGFSIDFAGQKSGHGSDNGISLTSDYDIAKEHAEWSVEKFGSDEYIISINSNSLNILSGKYFTNINNDYDKAYSLYKIGLIDGVELCDYETGNGCEEFEIFIFNIEKLNELL